MNRSRGFTLIETIATMAILALVAAAGIHGVMQYHRDGQYRQLESNAMLTMRALNSFYEARCSSGGAIPSISSLVSSGFLRRSNDAYNPFGPDLDVTIHWGDPSFLEVSARIQGQSAVGVAANVGASRASGGRVYWEGLPRVLTADDNSYTMQLKRMYEPGACT